MNILLMTCRANSKEEDHELPGQMPLGLGYIAAYLEKHTNHSVTIIDIPHIDADYDFISTWIEEKEVQVLGFTTYVSSYIFLTNFTSYIKDRFPHLYIVAGGPLATTLPDILLKLGTIDVVVKGPGELAFLQIITNKEKNIPNQSIVTGILPLNIDELPSPNWQMLGYSTYNYLPPWHDFPIMTSRGCPYNCNYCSKVTGKIYYRRSVPKIIDEITRAVATYSLKSFMIQDELLFASSKHLKEFCTSLIQSNLHTTWSAASRIDLLDEESVVLLKKAGCRAIGVGIESGSQRMLENMNKNLSLTKSAKNLKLLRQHDIKVMPYVIVGYPGETPETLNETESFLIENNLYSAMTYAFPFPGNVLWNIALERGMVSDIEKYLQRKKFSVSNMHYNFTEMSDENLVNYVELMKKRVLRNYIKNFIKKPLCELREENREFNIHIFGAGYLGKGMHEILIEDGFLRNKIKSFIDEDPRRIGGIYANLPITSLNDSDISETDVYFIANNYYPDLMHSKLRQKNARVRAISLG